MTVGMRKAQAPTAPTRGAMSRSRQALLRARTLLINWVCGYLRTQLTTPVRCTSVGDDQMRRATDALSSRKT
jgi:hypothetical protein